MVYTSLIILSDILSDILTDILSDDPVKEPLVCSNSISNADITLHTSALLNISEHNKKHASLNTLSKVIL